MHLSTWALRVLEVRHYPRIWVPACLGKESVSHEWFERMIHCSGCGQFPCVQQTRDREDNWVGGLFAESKARLADDALPHMKDWKRQLCYHHKRIGRDESTCMYLYNGFMGFLGFLSHRLWWFFFPSVSLYWWIAGNQHKIHPNQHSHGTICKTHSKECLRQSWCWKD